MPRLTQAVKERILGVLSTQIRRRIELSHPNSRSVEVHGQGAPVQIHRSMCGRPPYHLQMLGMSRVQAAACGIALSCRAVASLSVQGDPDDDRHQFDPAAVFR